MSEESPLRSAQKPRTSVYVDGFNLYHGKVQKTPYKWLDLQKLFAFSLPEYNVTRILYFTAIVRARPGNTDSPQNQLTYIRALETIPHLSVFRGFFLETTHPARLV